MFLDNCSDYIHCNLIIETNLFQNSEITPYEFRVHFKIYSVQVCKKVGHLGVKKQIQDHHCIKCRFHG